MTHGIIINPWNVILFMANLSTYLFIHLFKYSLHFFFTNNGMIRKISKTKVWPGRPIVFYYSYCPEKLYGNQLQDVKLIHRMILFFRTDVQYIGKYIRTSKGQF